MDTFKILYTALGGLGIFFFGMKMMSDSLQQQAGEVITKVINSLTTNRFLAVVVGIIVTMIVQSSSVTTVMVVGFVNAGLMQLTQAIGVIFGSNIGTTITGWIISIKVGKYGLLFIALGIFPILFSKSKKWQNIGKIVFGVGMIFFGLELMSGAFKPLRGNKEFLNFLSYFSEENYKSYLASILVGCLLTVIIQSSSAMLGITIALAISGVIGFNTAVALVLGENIGTRATAVGTTTNAKRAARAHAMFNLFGVGVVFAFLPYYLDFIEWLIPGQADVILEDGSKPNIATHIAASHTIFNITATILFLPFLGHLARLVTKITPEKEGEVEEVEKSRLILVGEEQDFMPATTLVQAEHELKKMKGIVDSLFVTAKKKINEDSQGDIEIASKAEKQTDYMQKEVTVFLCKVMEKPMSEKQSKKAQSIVKVVDELESIADYLEKVVQYKIRLQGKDMIAESLTEYYRFMDDIYRFYDACTRFILSNEPLNFKVIHNKSEELRLWANDIKDKHIHRVSQGDYDALSILTFSDLVVALRKIRAHSMNIAQAYSMTLTLDDE